MGLYDKGLASIEKPTLWILYMCDSFVVYLTVVSEK